MLGYRSAAELVGRRSHATVHYQRPDGSPYPESECPMLAPRVTGRTVHGEDEWFLRRDGSMFPIAWWSAPTELPGGLGAIFAFSDVTDRRRAEQAVRERDAAHLSAAQAKAAGLRFVEGQAALRKQVARDLHDGAQQRLVNVLLTLQLGLPDLADEAAREMVVSAIEQAQAAIADLRNLAAGLHPVVLSSQGLLPAVEDLANRAALPVTITHDVRHRIPAVVAAHAYYVIAEAVTNAIKHAAATRVSVAIATGEDALEVTISDDGIGGATAAHPGSGTGLVGAADRLAAFGGTFRISSPAGRGTSITAVFPLVQAL